LMPSEKRRKRRRKLKDLKLLILTAFSSEYIIMEIAVLFLKLCRHQFWFDGRKYPFTYSAYASPVNSICGYQNTNLIRIKFQWCVGVRWRLKSLALSRAWSLYRYWILNKYSVWLCQYDILSSKNII
jgi:hypothetical protein